MTPLTGTEKQVAWARTLRDERLASIDRLLVQGTQQAHAAGHDEATIAYGMEQYGIIRERIASQTAASWWIEQKALTDRQVMVKVGTDVLAAMTKVAAR